MVKITTNILQENESTALENATTLANVRWQKMKNSKAEIVYQMTMKYVKQMLNEHLITIDEYNKIDAELQQKYSSKISHLFLEIT